MQKIALMLSLVLLPGVLDAQAASYTYIDQKAPYSNPGGSNPWLTALTLPKIGTAFKVQVPGTWCCSVPTVGAQYSLGIGVSNPKLNTPFLKGFLYTSAEILIPTRWAGTSPWWQTLSFPIPNDSQLLGVKIYMQVLGRGITGGVIGLSRGGVATIGK
jgi:hypothetical protein